MATIEPYSTQAGRRYRVRYRKPDGAQTDKRGFRTKREAELFLATITVAKNQGTYVDPSAGRTTVRVFAEQWRNGRLSALKPSSRATMDASWRTHVEPKWGDRAVASIRSSEVDDWIGTLGKSLKPQTIRRAVFVLSGILSIAERDGVIARLPTAGAVMPAKTRKPNVYLTHRQLELLATNAEHPTFVRVLGLCGPRWGEAVALRVRHVNRLRRRLRVEDNAVMVEGAYVFGTPKSGEARDLPVPPDVMLEIDELCKAKLPAAFVFGDGGLPLRYPHAESGWFRRAVKRAQSLDETFPSALTPHDLRHTAASLAIAAGANVKVVQKMLGHASAAMTLDVYADLFDEDLDLVATRLGEARKAALS